jgi:hypothetical protein
MSTFYAVSYKQRKDYAVDKNEPIFVVKFNGKQIVMNGKKKEIDYWSTYFSTSRAWAETHVTQQNPFESLWRGGYGGIQFFDEENDEEYSEALKKVDDHTVVVDKADFNSAEPID